MGQGALTRRALLAGAAAAPLAACSPREKSLQGGWVEASFARGHRLRDSSKSGALPAPSVQRRCSVAIVGGGVAGLAAARALTRGGIDDVRMFELEDAVGGNSRGHVMGDLRCPLGAHYLPLPGPQAHEVIELLDDLGVRRTILGRAVYDERLLCHAPQERLFIDGTWRDGLLPPIDALPQAERATTLAQYRAFAKLVNDWRANDAFAIPTARSRWHPKLQDLDRLTFDRWLTMQTIDAPALRWYLDYCCRDDYGAGLAHVSAWAGLHYFASRHGFRAPGDSGSEDAGVLTWPEGNAWLTDRISQPLRERTQSASVAVRVDAGRHDVALDVWSDRAQAVERWTANHVVLAVPLFVAARLLTAPPAALVEAAARLHYAPWLVANLHVDHRLLERVGSPPAWDNVVYGGADLGYVDAGHQRLLPYSDATVITVYRALGGRNSAELVDNRKRLLAADWRTEAERTMASLHTVLPSLREHVRRVDLMRYGHAMAIPTPGLRSDAALAALAEPQSRVHFAHADLSGYSIFEEAYTHGVRAASQVAQGIG